MDFSLHGLIAVLEVIWINVLLSGDNAVVIALACRGLPLRQRRLGLVLGSGVAVLMRVVFTLIVVQLLETPFLRIAGSLLLLWIAVKLLVEEEDGDEDRVKASDKLMGAVWTIAVADMVMSLDNVLAIAAVAKNNTVLLVLGLVISIPLIVAGATLIMALLGRFPLLVWAGAALLGWVAGEMLDTDPWLVARFGEEALGEVEYALAGAGAALVVAAGLLLRRRAATEGA
ncbi:TerC family protein [Alsobacter sp. SYSU M60028]|uniref:TerC family protein n=1 Tax=Alsobacter ponti TaxID=2962936 RepID=A0ABT1LIM5_9HYPH|nr:TerC family protein [Alsobacter ponti]MCP8940806.1 TerC family protein [Alsobacter ponti]